MKKKLRRGLTLMELIVSFAILGVLSAALVGFIISSSNTYRSVAGEVNLQYTAQVVFAQVEDRLIDCNGGVAMEGDRLYIVNDVTDTGAAIHVYEFVPDENTINYGQLDYAWGDVAAVTADDFLTQRVTAFAVSFVVEGARATGATCDVSLQAGTRSYTASQTTALRNRPATRATLDALLAALRPEEP